MKKSHYTKNKKQINFLGNHKQIKKKQESGISSNKSEDNLNKQARSRESFE